MSYSTMDAPQVASQSTGSTTHISWSVERSDNPYQVNTKRIHYSQSVSLPALLDTVTLSMLASELQQVVRKYMDSSADVLLTMNQIGQDNPKTSGGEVCS